MRHGKMLLKLADCEEQTKCVQYKVFTLFFLVLIVGYLFATVSFSQTLKIGILKLNKSMVFHKDF